MLWPSIAAGSTPQCRHSAASAYSTTNSAGCVSRVSVECGAVVAGRAEQLAQVDAELRLQQLARSGRPPRGRRARAAYSPRAHAGVLAPCPGNRNATGRAPPSCRPATPAAAAAARSAAMRVRHVAHDHGAPVGEGLRARAAACRRRRPATCSGCACEVLGQPLGGARRARLRLRADSTSSCGAADARRRRARGASSSTTCALVPPMPNELTPARRGASPSASHGAPAALADERAARRARAAGLGARKLTSGGSSRCLQRQHRLDQAGHAGGGVEVADVGLHRAEAQKPRRRSPARNACVSAAISIGSPSGVPVPCAST